MAQVSLLLITLSNAVDTGVSAFSNWLNFTLFLFVYIVFLFVYIMLPKFCQHLIISFLCSYLILKSFCFFISCCFSRKLVELGRGNIRIFRLCFVDIVYRLSLGSHILASTSEFCLQTYFLLFSPSSFFYNLSHFLVFFLFCLFSSFLIIENIKTVTIIVL